MAIEITCGFDEDLAEDAIIKLKTAAALIEQADTLMRQAEQGVNTDTCPDEVEHMLLTIKSNIEDIEHEVTKYEERG